MATPLPSIISDKVDRSIAEIDGTISVLAPGMDNLTRQQLKDYQIARLRRVQSLWTRIGDTCVALKAAEGQIGKD